MRMDRLTNQLQAALADEAPDGWWWLSSFGAGFSCHGALLDVRS